jgi:hypothetical protein
MSKPRLRSRANPYDDRLLGGVCVTCGGPVYRFCDHHGYVYKSHPEHAPAKGAAECEVVESSLCLCSYKGVRWTERPKRVRKPKTHIQDDLFEIPA